MHTTIRSWHQQVAKAYKLLEAFKAGEVQGESLNSQCLIFEI